MAIWALLAMGCGGSSPTVELDDEVRTAAIVRWRSREEGVGSVRYGLEGAALDEETPTEAAGTRDHEVRVAGLIPGETWAFEAVVDGEAEEIVTLDVPPPPHIPGLTVAGDTGGDGLFLLHTVAIDEPDEVMVVDRAGRPRFFAEAEAGLHVLTAAIGRDGRSVWYTSSPTDFGPSTSYVHHVAFDGSYHEVTEVDGAHSGVVELPEGGFGFIRKAAEPFDQGTLLWDEIWERDADGAERMVFSLRESFEPRPMCDHWILKTPVDEGPQGEWYDWTHSNSLVLSEDETAWYMVVRHFDAIIGVERATGEILFVLGGPFASILPPSPEAAWQHPHLSVMTSDRIFVFDNRPHAVPPLPRASEYAWDLGSRSLSLVWETPGDREIPYLGDVDPLGDDVIVSWSSEGQVEHLTRDGDVLWTLESELGVGVGRVTPLTDLYGR
jgi:hypothetical protein